MDYQQPRVEGQQPPVTPEAAPVSAVPAAPVEPQATEPSRTAQAVGEKLQSVQIPEVPVTEIPNIEPPTPEESQQLRADSLEVASTGDPVNLETLFAGDAPAE